MPRHSGVAGSSTDTQRRSSASWMTVGRSVASAVRSAPSNSASRVHADPARAGGAGDRREVERSELRGDALAGAAPLLPHPDRAVALVVEAEDDDAGALADRGLELAHRHRQAAVADDRDDLAVAVDERRGDRRGQPVAHRARCRAEERAGTPEPEAAGHPPAEVAGVDGHDGVVGEDPAERADDAAGMDARDRPTGWRRRSCPPPMPPGPRRWRRPGSRRARRRGRHRRAAGRWRP